MKSRIKRITMMMAMLGVSIGMVFGMAQSVQAQNGTKIAFASSRDGNSEIYVMNADGSNLMRLTNNTTSDLSPAFSPDGTKIAFTSFRDGNFEIYVMDADGSNQTNITNNSAFDSFPAFSPDGTKIAFTSDRDGNFEIYVMDADGTNQTRLTNNTTSDSFPAFSPDGTKIAFTSFRDGNFEIYVMGADGSNQTNITNNSAPDAFPSWGGLPDADGDGVPDADDVCSDTVLPEARPLGLKRNRFYANGDGDFVDADGTSAGITVIDTGGCSGIQIIEAAGLGSGHVRYGITRSALEAWIATLP